MSPELILDLGLGTDRRVATTRLADTENSEKSIVIFIKKTRWSYSRVMYVGCFVQSARHYVRYVMIYELCGYSSPLGMPIQDEPRTPVDDRGVLSLWLLRWRRGHAGRDRGRRGERCHSGHEWSWGVPTLERWSDGHGGSGGGWRWRHGGRRSRSGGVEESGGGGWCGLLELEFWA